MQQIDRKVLRRREKRAAEKIMGNPHLREHLTDEQAERLLNWAVDEIAHKVEETQQMTDAEAQPKIEEQVEKLSQLLQNINMVSCDLGQINSLDSASVLYDGFLTSASQLHRIPKDVYEASQEFLDGRSGLSREEISEHCIDTLFAITKHAHQD